MQTQQTRGLARSLDRFSLPERMPARLDVFDVSGRPIVTLADGVRDAGTWSAVWDGRNAAGRRVTSGTSFYRLHAGSERRSGQLVRLE